MSLNVNLSHIPSSIFYESKDNLSTFSTNSTTQEVAPSILITANHSYETLNQKLLVEDLETMLQLAENLRNDSSLEAYFFSIVERSKTDPDAAIAAANAISILCIAGISFSNKDFRGIRVPNAFLPKPILFYTDFSYADLTNVKSYDAYMVGTSMAFSQAKGIDFGQRPYLKLISPINDMAISSSRSLILVALAQNSSPSVLLINFDTGKEVKSFGCGNAKATVFSPDEKMALFCHDRSISYIDLNSDKIIHEFDCHYSSRECIAFSSDGKQALVGSYYSLHLLDLTTGAIQDLHVNAEINSRPAITSVAFSGDGKQVIAATKEGIYFWNLESPQELPSKKVEIEENKNYPILISSNRKQCLSILHDFFLISDLYTGKKLSVLSPQDKYYTGFRHVALSTDGKRVLFADYENSIRLWDVASNKELYCFRGHTSEVTGIAFSFDDKWVLSSDKNGTIHIWDSNKGNIFKTKQSKEPPSIISCMNDKKKLPNNFSVYDYCDEWYKDNSAISSSAYSSDGKLALIGMHGERFAQVFLLDVCEKKIRWSKEEMAYSLAISSDSKRTLSASKSDGKIIHLCDLETGNEVLCLKGHLDEVKCLKFSLDGLRALSGSNDSTVRLWDLTKGCQLFNFEDHSAGVKSVDFSPNGKLGLSSSKDETICLWDLTTYEKIYRFKNSYQLDQIQFLPDGRHFVGSVNGSPVVLWQVFDEQNNLHPSLLWSLDETFTVHNLNLEGISGLSEVNMMLLKQNETVSQRLLSTNK